MLVYAVSQIWQMQKKKYERISYILFIDIYKVLWLYKSYLRTFTNILVDDALDYVIYYQTIMKLELACYLEVLAVNQTIINYLINRRGSCTTNHSNSPI